MIFLSLSLMVLINIHSSNTDNVRVYEYSPREQNSGTRDGSSIAMESDQQTMMPQGGLRKPSAPKHVLPKRISTQKRISTAYREHVKKYGDKDNQHVFAEKKVEHKRDINKESTRVENKAEIKRDQMRKTGDKDNQISSTTKKPIPITENKNTNIVKTSPRTNRNSMGFVSKYEQSPAALSLSESIAAAKKKEKTKKVEDDDDDDDDDDDGSSVKRVAVGPDPPSNGNTMDFVSRYKDSPAAKALANVIAEKHD
eukprot:CAMPEP_0172489494 /NCGR_PEP_ID=MMETSP1066-20121228/19526_1 /TAXON_ID=671091 /ORGANISM="Coscinodiscus wailesii, Strain CCMP2513" /LENGTH=253 /DNA_ID=CAMNT_0013257405 /DNA_START=209 /DNA_END=970 /DNA_ORIENTATION=-